MRDGVLVLGIGSPIMCDDAVGLRVVKEIEKKQIPGVSTVEACTSGLDLIEVMLDYERVIIVDAIMNSSNPPGTVMTLTSENFSATVHGTNPHEANIATTLELGMALEPQRMPQEIFFVAIEVVDVYTVSESMTPPVEAAIDDAVKVVLSLIKRDA